MKKNLGDNFSYVLREEDDNEEEEYDEYEDYDEDPWIVMLSRIYWKHWAGFKQ